MPKDFYAVLAVDRNSTRDQIRSRFLSLARERHPDLFSGQDKAKAEAEFQGITEAFNVLYNPERRRVHDMELSSRQVKQQAADPSQLMKVYMGRGIKAYREKKYIEAAENFDRATKTEESNAQAWHYLALACSQSPRWRGRALAAIAQACEVDKMNAEYHKLAGRLFTEAGMPLRAEKYLRSALEWGGPDAEVEDQLRKLKKGK